MQYVYGVAFARLKDIFETRNGYTPSKANSEYWEDGDIPWFRMDDIRKNGRVLRDSLQHVSAKAIKGKPFPAGSIIVSTTATIGEHAMINAPFLANQRFTVLTLKDELSNVADLRYLFYCCYRLDEYCKEHIHEGNFASVDMEQFEQFEFALPPVDEQARIAETLDRFDALCNDLSNGIPAEIEARQKQYEHYRAELLSFERQA